jgi:hypothetical protein
MAAPTGNQFWKARHSHGRGLAFSTPEVLAAACYEYFQWVEDNPLPCNPTPFTKPPKEGEEAVVLTRMRPMTLVGLYNFLEITRPTWDDYREREDFSAICTRVEQIIYQQKFDGAATDLFNANIIVRDLGLREKTDAVVTGEGGGPMEIIFTKRVVRADPKP